MKKGQSIFGKAYEVMLKNDLHDKASVDYKFLTEMILLDESSYSFLYKKKPQRYSLCRHELYGLAQEFKKDTAYDTIKNVLNFTNKIADSFNETIENMYFGGTEKQIIERGTDWCADMARVAAVFLDCLDIPCRMIHLANPDKAYNGHVVVEAFYENKWGVIDPIYGWIFYEKIPLSAQELQKNSAYLNMCKEEYKDLYKAVAVSEYNPMNPANRYDISKANDYYIKLLSTNHNNQWIMGEDMSH